MAGITKFSFGPGSSYFVYTKEEWRWSSNIPQGLSRILLNSYDNITSAIHHPHDVALGLESGCFAMSWMTVSGEIWREEDYVGPKHNRLKQFLVDLAGTHSVNTVYGPNDSFWTSSAEGYSWQNLPEPLEEYIQQQLTPKGWKSSPLQVALGVEKTYVALFSDGVIFYELAGYYDDLIKIIEVQWRDIVFVALNPFEAGEYFVSYKNGNTVWNCPDEFEADIMAVAETAQVI